MEERPLPSPRHIKIILTRRVVVLLGMSTPKAHEAHAFSMHDFQDKQLKKEISIRACLTRNKPEESGFSVEI